MSALSELTAVLGHFRLGPGGLEAIELSLELGEQHVYPTDDQRAALWRAVEEDYVVESA